MFLPNLTPVDESVPLLEGAYGCLIKLGDVLYEQKEAENTEEKEMKYWDRLMRKGVLMGYAHSSEHPAIANVLVQSMGKLVAKMGVHAVKYLKVGLSPTNIHTFSLCQTPSVPVDANRFKGYHPHPLNNTNRPLHSFSPLASPYDPQHSPNNNRELLAPPL